MIRFTAVLAALALTGSSVAAMVCDGWCGAGHTVWAHCYDEMPLSAESAISGPDRPCASVLREEALVRQDDRRVATIALLTDIPETLVDSRARPIGGSGGVNQPLRKALIVLRL